LPDQPDKSVSGLVNLYHSVETLNDEYWKMQKLKEIQNCIEAASGLFLDATTNNQYVVEGDSMQISITANNRSSLNITGIDADMYNTHYVLGDTKKNVNLSYTKKIYMA